MWKNKKLHYRILPNKVNSFLIVQIISKPNFEVKYVLGSFKQSTI